MIVQRLGQIDLVACAQPGWWDTRKNSRLPPDKLLKLLSQSKKDHLLPSCTDISVQSKFARGPAIPLMCCQCGERM